MEYANLYIFLLAAIFDRSSTTRIRLSATAEHTKPTDKKKEKTTLTATEAAEYLDITRSYLYKLMMWRQCRTTSLAANSVPLRNRT